MRSIPVPDFAERERFELTGNLRSAIVAYSPFGLIPAWILCISWTAETGGPAETLLAAVLFAIPVMLWGYAYGWRYPTYFDVTPGELRICFILRTIRVPVDEITEVTVLQPNSLSGGARLLSHLGMYSLIWTVEAKGLGLCNVYTGDFNKLVLIRSNCHSPMLIGVDLPGRFTALLRKHVRRAMAAAKTDEEPSDATAPGERTEQASAEASPDRWRETEPAEAQQTDSGAGERP